VVIRNLVRADHQHGAVGMPDNRIGDTPHQGPPYPAEPPASHDYEACPYLLAQAYDLLVLEDDRGFFPDYSMAPVVRRETLQQHPELAVHLERLAAVLDNETMARLNRTVDMERAPVRDVASEYLRSNGLI